MPESEERRRARVLVRVFGCGVVGAALGLATIGVFAGIPALTGLGLVIAAEETLEFAVVAGALRLRGVPRVAIPAIRWRTVPARTR